MKARIARLVTAATMTAIVALSFAPVAAHAAQGIPFNDPHTQGSIGFCDRNGKPVTSGKVTDIPFVWKAVSSVPAPDGYYGTLGKAVLSVFQPRPQVDPGEWTGIQFTASSKYTNQKHPMTQATTLDRPLLDFTSIAPLWDGYAQVRMYFSNVNMPAHTLPYPAAVIKITGDTWTLASKGPVPDCTAGTAVSAETLHIDPTRIPSASPTLLGPNGDKLPTSAATAAGVLTGSPDPSSGSSNPSSSSIAAVASTSAPSSSGVPAWVWAGLILLPALGVIGGFLAARRSGGGGAHSS